MKEKEALTLYTAPAPKESTADQHHRDKWLFHHTRKWIMARMKWFAQEFERRAETAKQGVQAERFKVAVQDIAEGDPPTAADFGRAPNFPGWLKRHAGRFEELATTPPQKELAASFRQFAREVGSPAVKEIFQKPLVNELVQDIKAWMGGSSNGVPFAKLSHEGKREYLGVGIDWTDYINRGLAIETKETWRGIDAIIDNVIAGKPTDQWVDGTGPKAGIRGTLRAQLEAKPSSGKSQQPKRPKDPERTP
jgi:hypothetical protein